MSPKQPEAYYVVDPTPYVPNSHLPVLIYRSCFPAQASEGAVRQAIEANHWYQGGVFKHYPAHHFHSVTHECYAVFKGRSSLLLGVGPHDCDGSALGSDTKQGVEVMLNTGDAIVLPAGVAHCCLQSWEDYEYVGLYPEGSPHWDNNFCEADEQETKNKAEIAKAVPIPEYDPLFGYHGPLVGLWKAATVKRGE